MSENELGKNHRLIVAACKAASVILERHGVPADEVANGFLAFGGAIAVKLVGTDAAAEIFVSKADGLRASVH